MNPVIPQVENVMRKTTFGMWAGDLIFAAGVGYKIRQRTHPHAPAPTVMKTKIYIPSDDALEALINTPNLTWEKIADHYPPSVGVRD